MRILVYSSVTILAVIVMAMIEPSTSSNRCKQMSPRSACINNLRQIDAAKEQWALENKKTDGDPIRKAEILQYINGGKITCPAHGIYTFGKVGAAPTCTIEGHTLY